MNKFELIIKASIIAKKLQKKVDDTKNNTKVTILALNKILNNNDCI